MEQFTTYVGFIILLFVSYFVIILVENFFYKFVKITYYLALISIPLFLLQILFPSELFQINNFLSSLYPRLLQFGGQSYSNSIIFTFRLDQHLLRNCGFSWEPGAFGFFLVLATLFHLVLQTKLKIDKVFVVFTIAIITTFSTTAYIGLITILIYYTLNSQKIKIAALLTLTIPIFIFMINLPFMKDKVEDIYYNESNSSNIEYSIFQADRMNTMYTPNRFASFVLNYNTFIDDPLFGKGLNNDSWQYMGSVKVNFANGVSVFAVKFGALSFSLFFIMITLSLKKISELINKKFYLIIVLSVVILGFSEPLFESPIFFSIQYYFLKKDDFYNYSGS